MIHPFVLFAIVLIVIWTISGVASAMNKAKEQERRRLVRRQIEREAQGSPRAPRLPRTQVIPTEPPPPQRATPQMIEQFLAGQGLPPPVRVAPRVQREPAPIPVPAGPRRVAKGKQKRPVAAIPVEVAVAPAPVAAPAPVRPVARPQPVTVNANTLSSWLRPGTLRKQFILTEILSPPLSMREESSHR
jgi:hypothetical protein